eukprot:m.21247 g.21247  ORF g.21247 m.21247 type:complete len:359 (+) comp28151_c0_seq6:45-1121(+)
MALSSFLPAPLQAPSDAFGSFGRETAQKQVVSLKSRAPPYGHRRGWVPRTPQDFGDGGAFPEIHVAQYPLGMGQTKTNDSNAIPIQLDSEGKIKYDVLAKQGQRRDKVVHTHFKDLLPMSLREGEDKVDLSRPDDEEVQKTTEKTKNALEKLVSTKIAAAMPTHVPEQASEAQYIRYTPAQQGQAFNSGAQQRIISMVEKSHSMEPLTIPVKIANIFSDILATIVLKGCPRGPLSPPVPILHSPSERVSNFAATTTKRERERRIAKAGEGRCQLECKKERDVSEKLLWGCHHKRRARKLCMIRGCSIRAKALTLASPWKMISIMFMISHGGRVRRRRQLSTGLARIWIRIFMVMILNS